MLSQRSAASRTPSSGPRAKFFGEGFHSAAWADLLTSVKTGESAFARVHGKPAFAWVAEHPREGEVFNEAMTSISTMSAFAVASTDDLSSAKTIVDVGGGHGFFLSSLLLANPNARGILFDMPHVVEGAKQPIAQGGLATRCEIVGGDWDDDDSVTILSHCAAAVRARRLEARARRAHAVAHVDPRSDAMIA